MGFVDIVSLDPRVSILDRLAIEFVFRVFERSRAICIPSRACVVLFCTKNIDRIFRSIVAASRMYVIKELKEKK